MKTRVLILEQQSFWGGGQRVLQTVLNSLRDEIEPVIALPHPGTFGLDLQRQKIETLLYPLGSYRSGSKSIVDFVSFGPRSTWCALRLAAIIVERKFQLVYINGSRCLLAGAMAARLTRRPSLFCLHNTLSRGADVALASRAAAHVSRIIACSQAAAAPLLRANPSLSRKLQILYAPVEELSFTAQRPAAKRSRFVIGVVGRITEAKGHHVLLSALARLGSSPGREVMFVGEPAPGSLQDLAYFRSLRSFISEHGLDSSIRWAGYQPDPNPCYEAMDLLVVPSTGAEGFPLVILEAFQRGIPVIASQTGGIPELVKEGVSGILVPPGNPDELARAIDRLQRDPALRRQLGETARVSIDGRFLKQRYCSTIGDLISELCLSSTPGSAVPAWRKSSIGPRSLSAGERVAEDRVRVAAHLQR